MTQETPRVVTRKKLIEVALPLDAINAASKREKSIRHGHPSTLHLWWARRPLAAARAVIFAQLVDDPSATPERFPTERSREDERQRLFQIIENFVKWENTTNEEVLQRARDEIWESWRRTCADNSGHPRAEELFNPRVLPSFHDPFAGGGSLPLEAQRLGLESLASDLNPVAVLINLATIEIPARFVDRPPINPQAQAEVRLLAKNWPGAQGLAEDVRYYGQWMCDEAKNRVGHLYPRVRVTQSMATDRPDLRTYVGRDLTAIAWIWARTVKSPNPAFADVDVPLASTFVLSKRGDGAYVKPVVEERGFYFSVKAGKPPAEARDGTKLGRGANFRCLLSGTPITADYIKSQGQAGLIGTRLMAIVAQGVQGRVFVAPSQEHEARAMEAQPEWKPELSLPSDPRNFWTVDYGLTTFGDLFTQRQLVALTTLADLVVEAHGRIQQDAVNAGLVNDGVSLRNRGCQAKAYADAISVYLSCLLSQVANHSSSVCGWNSTNAQMRSVFARQAIPMVWDFAESNLFCNSSGSFANLFERQLKAFNTLAGSRDGKAFHADVNRQTIWLDKVMSTDPPYYDNIGYADLSDFFYVWLRRSLQSIFPDVFSTVSVPKAEELVATPYRHDSREKAEAFFLSGMTRAMAGLSEQVHPAFPITVYYAFKQSETKSRNSSTSTGWETFLDAVIQAGLAVVGTWPIRTEKQGRVIGNNTNALASSIVLACRSKSETATTATRRQFQEALQTEFPKAIEDLQRSNIAPADLAQAAIGPGMAVFTRFRDVLNADGSSMSVREALGIVNAALDEALAEQEGDFDSDTRWAVAWLEQHGFSTGEYGIAEQLSKAKNTSVEGLVRAGLIDSQRGKVRLLQPSELAADWDPLADRRLTVWEMTHHLIRLLAVSEQEAAELTAVLGSKAETARDLAYRLYTVSGRERRAADALQYNGLVQSWPEITQLARQRPKPRQTVMLSQAEDGP